MDALSELLKVVRLSGAVFFNARCGAPWCLRSPPSARLRQHLTPPPGQVIEFHLVTAGHAYVRVRGEATALQAGDLIVLPHGDEHFLGNGPPIPAFDAEPELHALLRRDLRLSSIGGSGEETRFVCGYLSCEPQLIRPALSGLPALVRVHLRRDPFGEWMEQSISQAVRRAEQGQPGSAAILARLAEVLFAEALRRHVLEATPEHTGWLAAAGDAIVGRSLAALHGSPAHPWTLDELAQTAGASRSVLTERFARYLGQSPMGYLADWRLELAADALRNTKQSVVQIAAEVGYDSEAAFNRAFKRRFAEPPARYRRNLQDRAMAGAGSSRGAARDPSVP